MRIQTPSFQDAEPRGLQRKFESDLMLPSFLRRTDDPVSAGGPRSPCRHESSATSMIVRDPGQPSLDRIIDLSNWLNLAASRNRAKPTSPQQAVSAGSDHRSWSRL
jgi:hypothetical protein